MMDRRGIVLALQRNARWFGRIASKERDIDVRRQYLEAAEAMQGACLLLTPREELADQMEAVAKNFTVTGTELKEWMDTALEPSRIDKARIALVRKLWPDGIDRLSDTAPAEAMRWAIARDSALMAAKPGIVARYAAVTAAVLQVLGLVELDMLSFDWIDARKARETCIVIAMDVWGDAETLTVFYNAFGQLGGHRRVGQTVWERQRDTDHYHAAIAALAGEGEQL